MPIKAFLRLLALLAALTPALVATVHAQQDGLAGDIAYVTRFGQLAVVDPTGGEPRLLSPIGVAYQFPAFAPDGRRIAAIGVADGAGLVSVFGEDSRRDVYRSETEPPIYLYWSPDATILSFIAARAESGLGFWLADGDAEPYLVASGSPFYWSWDPSADTYFAHIGLTGEGSRLAFGDGVDGLDDDNLDSPGWFQAPGISASGAYVAYAAAGALGGRRIVIATHPEVEGAAVRRELGHQGVAMLGWNPVADVIAVMAPRQPAPHWFGPIDLLDAADGLLEPLVEDVALAFFWSPDGDKLAYVAPAPAPDVQRVQVAGLALQTQLPIMQRTDGAPIQQGAVRLSLGVVDLTAPDGERDRTIATFTPSLAFVDQFLPFFDQYAQSHRVWAPTSDALVLPVVGIDGVTRVTVFGLDGSQRPLAQGDMPFWNVR